MVTPDQSDGASNEQPNDVDSDSEERPAGGDGDMSRRSVLKLAGVAATATGVGTVATGPTKASIDITEGDGYEIWTIEGPELYDISDGETLSNVLIDQTASGASLTIRSRNKTDWTVRNVGFLGVGEVDGGKRFQLQVSAPSGGQGTVENVWANGKARDGQSATELGGIYVRSSHAGHLDIRHTYIEGFGNNAVYGSAVGKDSGADGSVRMENCYHRDNTVSQFRIGSPNSVVRNCVGVLNDPDGDRGWYPGTDGNRNARGIWGKHFRDQQLENCSFYFSPDDIQPDGVFEARYIPDRSHGEEAVVGVQDCQVNGDAPTLTGSTSNARVDITNLGESPTVGVIEDGGVPTTPEMAARGDREMPPALPGESDDTSGSEDTNDSEDTSNLIYGNDASSVYQGHYDTGDTAGVKFSMTNGAEQALTVTHLGVTPHDSSINELHDESSEIGPWVSEVYIEADTQDGVCDVPGSATLPNTFDLANDGWDDAADNVAEMSDKSTATIALSRFEDDGSPIDMTGKSVDIEVGYELANGTTSTDLFTVTPDDPNSAPTIDSLSVREVETADGDAAFDADWQVGDADSNLNSVDLTLIDESVGGTEDTAAVGVSGDTASGTTRLIAAGDDGSGNQYSLQLLVSDSDGGTTSDVTSVTEAEPNTPPTVDSLSVWEVETADSDAVFDADWQVSDADGNLDSVDLTLSDDTDGEIEDTTAVGVSGDTAGRTTRLVAAGDDVSGNQYTVQLLVTDSDGATGSDARSLTESDPDPVVSTGSSSDLTDSSSTLHGSLKDLGGADSANVAFEWRESGATTWNSTTAESVTTTGSFSHELTGLTADTTHEYRAIAHASDGESATGTGTEFTTAVALERTLTFDGTDADWTEYEVAVSGEIKNDPDNGSFDDDDSVEGQIASGFVNGGTDGYRFSGEIVGIEVNGNATVLVDGLAVDPDSLVLPNHVVFDANGSQVETTYEVEVSGDLVNDPLLGSVEGDDTVDPTQTTGVVTDGDRDGFRFEGDLVSLRLDGEASVIIEDTDG